jgi:DNA-binding winged helix-turn-helix (wHTH) protein
MPSWDQYPEHYRCAEVQTVLKAVQAGDSAAVIGLSGAGKSNLLGFLAHRVSAPGVKMLLVDCNRLAVPDSAHLYAALRKKLGETDPAVDEGAALEKCLENYFDTSDQTLALLLDRFDLFLTPRQDGLYNNLRALRDAFKYQLAYVTSARQPLPLDTELSELFSGCTLWLGPLSEEDARWSVARYSRRTGFEFGPQQIAMILALTGGYPALLRAACEALAAGALTEEALVSHPAVQQRLEEFWSDHPSDDALSNSHMTTVPLIQVTRPRIIDRRQLTAKEVMLLDYFQAHPDQVCEKDDLIRAVWPEDRIFQQGVRDDSLAQLVKRLRGKIEPDPANPSLILTVPGRGYEYQDNI